MNRRVLAALITLADVHEAKETGVGANDAYGRGGVMLDQLAEDDYALYEKLAEQLCAEAKVVTDDPEAQALLHHARHRTLPTHAADPLPPAMEQWWVCVVRKLGSVSPDMVDSPHLFRDQDKGVIERDEWRYHAERCQTGNVFEVAELLVPARKP